MPVDRFASCENNCTMCMFVEQLGAPKKKYARFRTSSILPPSPFPTRDWSLNPLEETLLQPVLKSFITVFIQNNEGLENNLTRASLLGLAKSIYYSWFRDRQWQQSLMTGWRRPFTNFFSWTSALIVVLRFNFLRAPNHCECLQVSLDFLLIVFFQRRYIILHSSIQQIRVIWFCAGSPL